MNDRYSPLNLSAVSVRRKIAVSCFLIALILLGAASYSRIGIDILPRFDVPYVQITAVYAGASPEEIENEIARPIEEAVGSLDGLKHTPPSAWKTPPPSPSSSNWEPMRT